MVKVELYRVGKDGPISGFHALGHSGYAPRGNDIVCAAVSVLTTVTVRGIQQRLRLKPDVTLDQEEGLLECHLSQEDLASDQGPRAQDLLETMALGLKLIQEQYSKHLSVEEVLR